MIVFNFERCVFKTDQGNCFVIPCDRPSLFVVGVPVPKYTHLLHHVKSESRNDSKFRAIDGTFFTRDLFTFSTGGRSGRRSTGTVVSLRFELAPCRMSLPPFKGRFSELVGLIGIVLKSNRRFFLPGGASRVHDIFHFSGAGISGYVSAGFQKLGQPHGWLANVR